MHKLRSVILDAIKTKKTLIAEHRYCDVIEDPLTLEVYPYKLEGDFLICFDIEANQPYAINIERISSIKRGNNNIKVPPYPFAEKL